jgi:hypothetical protein
MNVQRLLIALGLLILMAGIAWPILSRRRRDPPRQHVLLPLVTCLLVSIVLSALFWLLNR